MDIARAKAIGDVARVIIDSAKVEVDMVKATGATGGSGFLPVDMEGRKAQRALPRSVA